MNVRKIFLKRPLAGWVIHAAFESPATDYEEDRISLDEYVTRHPEAVFYIRVTGDCMKGSGISDGDLLIVDRSLTPLNGDVIIGVLNGELTSLLAMSNLTERNIWYPTIVHMNRSKLSSIRHSHEKGLYPIPC